MASRAVNARLGFAPRSLARSPRPLARSPPRPPAPARPRTHPFAGSPRLERARAGTGGRGRAGRRRRMGGRAITGAGADAGAGAGGWCTLTRAPTLPLGLSPSTPCDYKHLSSTSAPQDLSVSLPLPLPRNLHQRQLSHHHVQFTSHSGLSPTSMWSGPPKTPHPQSPVKSSVTLPQSILPTMICPTIYHVCATVRHSEFHYRLHKHDIVARSLLNMILFPKPSDIVH